MKEERRQVSQFDVMGFPQLQFHISFVEQIIFSKVTFKQSIVHTLCNYAFWNTNEVTAMRLCNYSVVTR